MSASDDGRSKIKAKCVFNTKRKLGTLRSLNRSGLCNNTSLNSSAMKRTLRTNNRELARALELKKSELSLAQSEQMKLRLENQAQMQELIQLRACTNMQNIEDFEREVKRRVDQKMEKVREALHQMGASMSVVVQQIYNVTDLCNDGQLRKLSAQGSRHSAHNSRQSTDDTATTHTVTATAAACPEPAGRRSHPAARVAITEAANDDDQYEDVVEDSGAMSGMIESASLLDSQAGASDAACDLSMIMEQSYMDADFDLCLSAARSHSKSSTGSRSSDRRNVLVFRRSAFSQNDDDDIDDDEDDMCEEKLPASVSHSSQAHTDSQTRRDTPADDVVGNDALSEQSTQAAAAVAAIRTDDQVLLSDVPQSSSNSNISTRKSITDATKLSAVTEQDASSADTTPRGLTKREIPTFVSLNTSPPTVKKSGTAANRVGHRDRKGDDGRGNTSKSTARSRKKKTTASENLAVAKSDSRNFDDRRLTFVVNKTRPAEESSVVPTSPRKMRSGSIIRDHGDTDVENIMDQTDEILQDVSDCSEPFPGEDSNTLVPSVNSSLTLMPDHACVSASAMPSSAGFPPLTVAFTSNVCSQPADSAGELSAGNVTSLVVTDMEMTSINTSKSPQLFGNMSNDTPETALNSTAKSKTGSCNNAEETVIYREGQKDNQEPAGDVKKGRSKSKSRNTTTLSKRAKSSTSSAAYRDNVNSMDDRSDVEHTMVEQSHQQTGGVRQKHSVRAQSKHRTTMLQGPTVCSSADGDVANPDDEDGMKKSVNSKDISLAATVTPHNSDTQQKHQISKPSTESVPKFVTAGEVEEQAAEVLPKKVAAFMTKPGKIVYSTSHRRSASSEPAVRKSRSKSRSILPLQSRPRSKQPLVFADLHSDSPPSAFAFDGTPKEDTVCRPAAMLAARKKYMLLDDSVLVSEPAEKRPVMRQRSLSNDDASSSPHGIMLVLHNGKRTKPRTARSKSVRYGASETVCTPPASAHRKQLDVPLTPYARASEAPTSDSTDLDNAVAGIVPESPVFTTASPLQQTTNEDVSQSTVIACPSGTKDQTSAHDKSNMDQITTASESTTADEPSTAAVVNGDDVENHRKKKKKKAASSASERALSSRNNVILKADTTSHAVKRKSEQLTKPGRPTGQEDEPGCSQPKKPSPTRPVSHKATKPVAVNKARNSNLRKSIKAGQRLSNLLLDDSMFGDGNLSKQSADSSRLSATVDADQSSSSVISRESVRSRPPSGQLSVSDISSTLRLSQEGGRSRRAAAAAVNYKEPALGSKLRQGDKFTSSVYLGTTAELPPKAGPPRL